MTLFGRDSLLTSWMTMLVDPDLALGTLQTLARFQGDEVDPLTEEEPGRILHEMRFGETRVARRSAADASTTARVDATPLFVMLARRAAALGEPARRSRRAAPRGRPGARVDRRVRRPDGDGYVEYQRTSDRGLQNQGWKDSWDSMRFADGTLAPTADRAVRGAGLRVRRAASPVRTSPTETGDDALRARRSGAAPPT